VGEFALLFWFEQAKWLTGYILTIELTDMKLKIFILLGSAFFWMSAFQPTFANEFKMGKVIAYPNPFAPESDRLVVKPENSSAFEGMVTFKVYNFNEKEVFSGQVSNSAIYWSGHTADGKRLLPGLYFIKIIQSRNDYATGSTIIKLIVK